MWRNGLITVGLGLGACVLSCDVAATQGATSEILIHVAPDGNDASTGTSATAAPALGTGPVATLPRAQALARAAVQAADGTPARKAVRVLLAPGTYELAAPLVFTPEDSGTAAAPVSYEAATTGTVTLSGGVRLVQRRAARDGTPAVFELPEAAKDLWRGGGQLFVNGERATLARQPKAGRYWFVQRTVPLASEPPNQLGHEAFAVASEARVWLTSLEAAERSRAIVQLMHSWNVSQHRIADFASGKNVVRITPRSKWSFLSSGHSQRWWVENVPSALTQGGEWVATATELRYLPRTAQTRQALVAVLPKLENLVLIRGDAAADKWVEHLSFRGLGFAHTRFLTPETGFVDPQAAIGVGASVEADGARHLSFQDCTFSQTASYAVWLRRAVTDTQVINSTFNDLGGGGIQVGVARDIGPRAQATARIAVRNNTISHTGAVFPGAVAVWVGQAHNVTVAHNLIHNTSYTGISVGWTWGFGPAASSAHRIVNNLLVNIGGAQLSDQGGIYTLGRLPDTVISGNVIREVRAYSGYGPGPGWGGWGIYNDEGTSGVRVENNIVVGTDSGGYHLNKGQDNMVRHNLFAGGTLGEVRVSQPHTQTPQATLDGNLLIPLVAQPFDGLASAPHLSFVGNHVSAAMAPTPLALAKCNGGCGTNSAQVSSGPGPRELVFSGLDAAMATRVAATVHASGPALLTRSATTPAPMVTATTQAATQALAPPLPLAVDLPGTAQGSLPSGLQYRPIGDSAAIQLISLASAPGGRCLQFTDSAAMGQLHDPHAFALLNHDSGTSSSAFSLLIDAETDFIHEWRDNARPYRTGPSLRVTAAGIDVGGKRVAPASVGQWIHVRLTSPLANTGLSWTLEVSVPGQPPLTLPGLAPVSPAWRTLNYVGYISNANRASSFCLADLQVSSSKQQE
jgi:Right handed beta helix region